MSFLLSLSLWFVVSAQQVQAQINITVTKTDAVCGCDGTIYLELSGCSYLNEYKFQEDDVYSPPMGAVIKSGVIPIGGAVSTMITGLCPGTYTYTMLVHFSNYDDGTPIWSIVGVFTRTIAGEPALDASVSVVNGNCAGTGSATVSVTGGNGGNNFNFQQWISGDWFAIQNSQSNTITGLENGSYRCIVTDIAGCADTVFFTISGQGGPVDFALTVTQPPCTGTGTGGAAIRNITGTSNYTVVGPGGTGGPWSGLAPGTYSITVTDVASGCAKIKTFTIAYRDPVTADLIIRQSGCEGANTGRIEVSNVEGATNPITYTWSPNVSSTAVADNLTPGVYTVTVTSANGCTWSRTTTITNVPPLTFSLATRNYRVAGVCYGRAEAILLTGTPPYTYTWASPSGCGNTPYCVGAAPGYYEVTVTDFNGCEATQAVTIFCTSPKIIVVAPNPMEGDNINITYALSASQFVKFKLYNANFSDVGSASVGTRPSGTNTDNVTFTGLSSGTYYLNLILDDVSEPDVYIVVK